MRRCFWMKSHSHTAAAPTLEKGSRSVDRKSFSWEISNASLFSSRFHFIAPSTFYGTICRFRLSSNQERKVVRCTRADSHCQPLAALSYYRLPAQTYFSFSTSSRFRHFHWGAFPYNAAFCGCVRGSPTHPHNKIRQNEIWFAYLMRSLFLCTCKHPDSSRWIGTRCCSPRRLWSILLECNKIKFTQSL